MYKDKSFNSDISTEKINYSTFFSTPKVMGILNITNNSFYDGGKYINESSIIKQCKKMIEEGVDIIDIGACSSKPGSSPVEEKKEIEIIKKYTKLIKQKFPKIIVSVDTFRSSVAEIAIKNNADIILFLNLSFLKISENKFFLNLKAEIYNVKLENFITSWSTPTKEINFTNECDDVCKNLEITRKLVLMASQLGENVSKILSLNYQQKENKNFIQQYNLIISGLNNNETLSLTDIMINEFPGFVKLINKEQYGSNYKYKYFSSANNLKIKKWLIIALNQLNLSEGKDIEINVNSNLISINKYPNNLSSGSKGNPKKFN